MSGRTRALTVVIITIVLAAGMLAAFPSSAHEAASGPMAAVTFVDAWTNDDGGVNGADIGDTGLASTGFDVWPVSDSSDDPEAAGIQALRRTDDAARCVAEVRDGVSDFIDLTIDNGYPQYICTFTAVVENASSVPAAIDPALIEADDGLEAIQITDPPAPGIIGPGETAELVFAVRILNGAPQDSTLGLTITTLITNPVCEKGLVFGVERGSGNLYEIDVTAGVAYRLADITDPVPANVNSPNGLAYDGATNRLYFSASLEGAATSDLYFWDGNSMHLAGTVTGQAGGASIHDGAYYYVVNATDDLVKVTFTAAGAVANETTIYPGFAGTDTFRFGDLAISPDGSTLYGSTLQSGTTPPTFFNLDLGTGAYAAVSTSSGVGLQLAFGDDGVLYGQSTGTGEFFTVDPLTGSTVSAGTPSGALDGFTDLASGTCVPEWTPDPRILFWKHLAGAGEIGVIDSDGTNEEIFWESPVNFGDTEPAWSPDGTRIVFVRGGSAGARDIHVMPSGGFGSRTLVTLGGSHPDWSPDSTQIVFHANRIHPPEPEIYSMPISGGPASLLYDDGDQADWSPDGSQIAFRHYTGRKQIYVMNANGTNPTNISNSLYADEWPDWSPDGSQIAFSRNLTSSGPREIFVMNSDGTGVTQLTTIGGSEKPHWSPDGSRIVFSRFGEIWVMDADGSNVAWLGPGGDPSWEQVGP